MDLLEPGDENLSDRFERVENASEQEEGFSRIYIAGEGIFRYDNSLGDEVVKSFYSEKSGNSDLHYMGQQEAVASD